MGSVERFLVLGIVVVIVAILGITIWGAAGDEPGAVLPVTDGGMVSIAPGFDGASTGTGGAGPMPVSEIEHMRALRESLDQSRGLASDSTTDTGLVADAGSPAATGAGSAGIPIGVVPLETHVNVQPVPANFDANSLPVIGPDKPAVAKAATPGIHTVVKGDSIWRIAHRAYGDANIQEHIDAILAANPSVDPDNLQLGTKLVMPGADSSNVSRQPAAKQVAALSGTLYEVRKGDTLSDIARKQLGSVGKWQEIYELNRERIQDPGDIKPGTTLRLPNR